MSSKRRTHRIAEQIRTIIAMQLQRVADPRFTMVTITSVVVTSDLRQAKVYWVVSASTPERIEEVQEAFEGASGMMKNMVGRELGIRFSPDLRFYYDDTLDTVEQVERLFYKISQEKNGKDEQDAE